MKFWLGALLTLGALLLFVRAVQHRNRVALARNQALRRGHATEQPFDGHSIAALGEMITPIVLVALVYMSLKTSIAFYVLNNGALSIFDLAGALLLFAGYGTWLRSKTMFRMPPVSAETDVMRPDVMVADHISAPAMIDYDRSNPARPHRVAVGVRRLTPTRLSDRSDAHPIAQPTFALEPRS